MSRIQTVPLMIGGSVVGLLGGGMGVGWLAVLAFCQGRLVVAADSASFMVFFAPGFLIGATFGAVAGATLVRKMLRWRTSFWKGFAGGLCGLAAGSVLEILYNVAFNLANPSVDAWLYFTGSGLVLYVRLCAAVVIGSAWEAGPAKTHVVRGHAD